MTNVGQKIEYVYVYGAIPCAHMIEFCETLISETSKAKDFMSEEEISSLIELMNEQLNRYKNITTWKTKEKT